MSSRVLLAALAAAQLAGLPFAHACDLPPPPVRDLALERYYDDEAGTNVDQIKIAEHRRAAAPVRTFLKSVVREADASLRQSSPSLGAFRARCAADWLETWAMGGALLGHIDGKQAEAERRWTLAGAALAYLKFKPHTKPEQRVAIEAWLVRMADASQAQFNTSGAKPNNHRYWLGLGLAATGLAAASERHWNAARAIMEDAAADISSDGTLPLELGRGKRALHYHAFALMPLVMMTELARSRGEDWETFSPEALGRLVDMTARGLAEPALFDRLAGIAQERPVNPGAGWLQLWSLRHRDWVPPAGIEMASGHTWLGGNVLLFARTRQSAAR